VTSILDEILGTKRDEVVRLHGRAGDLGAAAAAAPPARDFAGALRRPDGRLALICEIKRRSPSKGVLADGLDPAAMAGAYERGGAAALSVLTDGPYFGGSLADLAAARAACSRPVLRKDFTIDEVQILEARAAGADAILLIVAALSDDGRLRALHEAAVGCGLAALVEADDELGVERALAAGARIVGVTNRDLRTFGEDLGVSERCARLIPPDAVAVAESAIRSADDAARMAAAGYDAALVGEALVRAPDPAALVAAMAAATVSRRGVPSTP
jgi:indole-3-glycerol phosphate synthase